MKMFSFAWCFIFKQNHSFDTDKYVAVTRASTEFSFQTNSKFGQIICLQIIFKIVLTSLDL